MVSNDSAGLGVRHDIISLGSLVRPNANVD
jgi:hypothetical protein